MSKPKKLQYNGDSKVLKYLVTCANWFLDNHTVGTLDDVILTDIADGQILKYDSTTSKFVNADESGGGGSVTPSITKVYDSNTSGSSSYTVLKDGLYLIINSYSYNATHSVTLSRTPIISGYIGSDRGMTWDIVNLKKGDVVTMVNTPSSWDAFGKIIYLLENITVDSLSDSEGVDEGTATLTPPSGNYLMVGVAMGRTSNDYSNNTDTTGFNGIKLEDEIGVNTSIGVYYGDNIPEGNFYGYDGGGGYIALFLARNNGGGSGTNVVANPTGTPIDTLTTIGIDGTRTTYYTENSQICSVNGNYVTSNLDTQLVNGGYKIHITDGAYEFDNNFTYSGSTIILELSANGETYIVEITSTTVGMTYGSGAWRDIYCDIYTEESGQIIYDLGTSADKVSYDNTTSGLTADDVQEAIDEVQSNVEDMIPLTQKGANGGVAELDSNGKVPSSQLPSYVDDVIEGYYNSNTDRFYKESTFITVIPPEDGKSWVDVTTNKSYRWTGSVYTRVDEGVQLGETSSTAYRGDRGKTAYEHSQMTSGNPHNVSKSDVGLGNVPNVSTNDQTPTFTQANTRANIASGEKLSVILGKIMKWFTDLKTVAFTNSYTDLDNKPTIPTNTYQSTDTAETTLADDDKIPFYDTSASGRRNSTWANIKAKLKSYFDGIYSTFSGSYNDLTDKPTIPTVNNATLNIKKNGTSQGTFTANASTDVNIDISIPTKIPDIADGFSSQSKALAWGNQIGEAILRLDDVDGGSLGFRKNNPLTSQMSMVIDGTFYVNEGRDEVAPIVTATIPSTTSPQAGWRRLCKIYRRGYKGYCSGSVTITGGWANGAPTIARIQIDMLSTDGRFTLLSNLHTGGMIQQLRLVSVSGGVFWLDAYMKEQSGAVEPQYFYFEGNFGVSEIQHSATIITDTVTTIDTIDLTKRAIYGTNITDLYFKSGNKSTETNDCNLATINGMYYYSSNGPTLEQGASTTDGALYTQAYSDSWLAQIAQDYRNGRLFVRGRNNGVWKPWHKIMKTDGDTMSGPLIVEATEAVGSYDEGIRINTGMNGFATILLGGTGNIGTRDGAFWIGVWSSDPRKLWITHGASRGNTYFGAIQGQTSPYLNLGSSGSIARGDTKAVTGGAVYDYHNTTPLNPKANLYIEKSGNVINIEARDVDGSAFTTYPGAGGCTLPTGYRPKRMLIVCVYVYTTYDNKNHHGIIKIRDDGTMDGYFIDFSGNEHKIYDSSYSSSVSFNTSYIV